MARKQYQAIWIGAKNWKLSRKDRFGVLLVACRDAIGNVSVQKEEEQCGAYIAEKK